jgi:hypothetical protein
MASDAELLLRPLNPPSEFNSWVTRDLCNFWGTDIGRRYDDGNSRRRRNVKELSKDVSTDVGDIGYVGGCKLKNYNMTDQSTKLRGIT